jgi:hypothetical protein
MKMSLLSARGNDVARKAQGVIEDSMTVLPIRDMSGGLCTAKGPLTLSANQTPDSLNIFAYNGQLLFRGGYNLFSTLPAAADGAFTFMDSGLTQHIMVWSGGSLYDCASGAPVLIRSGIYTAGQQIARCTLNGSLYWATLTVPLREYDGTTEQAVPNSGGTGVVPPPACNFLVPYAGSLVAIFPVPSGVPEPSSFMWSNVNDPTTWVGANIQTVGSNDGSICTFALLMGVVPGGTATTGIPATRQLLVGKNKENLFLYQGALGTLTENAVPCPVGALSAESAVYIPTKEGIGAVMFLGSDYQFYLTNGSSATVVSENIQNYLYAQVANAIALNPSQPFYAIYNPEFQYYLCDFGNGTQLAYKWDATAWWPFSGWPSGPQVSAVNAGNTPTLYVASSQGTHMGMFNIGLIQTNDNGADIQAYYTTPWLHGGQPEREKVYDRLTLFTFNVGVQYKVTGRATPRANNLSLQMAPLIFNDPAIGAVVPVGSGGVWDQSEWDNAVWGGGLPSEVQPYDLVPMTNHLFSMSTPTIWIPQSLPTAFRGPAVEIKIAWNGGVPDFRLTGIALGMLFRSTVPVGALPYQSEGAVQPTQSPFTQGMT